MVYIYEKNGEIVPQRDQVPQGVPYIELERMIPEPEAISGYKNVLRANFGTGEVKFERIETLDGVRARVIAAIEAYDKSEAVNQFFVAGMPLWLDRDTRTSLARTIAVDQEAGEPTCSIWYEGPPPFEFKIPIDMAGPMLDALERYAKACYNVTQGHIAALYALDTAADIEAYDYRAGYPDKLEFNP